MDEASTDENYTTAVLRRLKARGSRDAIVAGARRISGTEAVATVLRFAAALRSSGLADGDGVALFAENTPEAALLQLAVHFAGCRLVFVPPGRGHGELQALIRRADIKMLLFDPVFEERARQIAAQVDIPYLFSIGASSIATNFLAVASGAAGFSPHDAADGRNIATLFYTGGTTGMPKLVVHRGGYYDLLVQASGLYADEASPDPKMLICTLLTHTSGHVAFLVGLLSGHTVVLLRTFDAGTALSLMDSERVTTVIVVTPMLYDLLGHPDCLPGRFPSLRTLRYTGAAASPRRLIQAIERLGPVLHQIYGASESGLVTELSPLEHDLERPESLSSCGRPGPGVEVELRDENGKRTPVGQPGELYVRSRAVMEGYWNDPEHTAEVLDDDGWFHSGDIGREDENGYIYLVDRSRDVIVSGRTASNVYSRLLEDFLTAHPAIKDAVVVGLPGEDNKETVHVVLVPQDPANVPDFAQLTGQIVDELGDPYAPSSYSITDFLPRTTVGKIDKKSLREAVLTARQTRNSRLPGPDAG